MHFVVRALSCSHPIGHFGPIQPNVPLAAARLVKSGHTHYEDTTHHTALHTTFCGCFATFLRFTLHTLTGEHNTTFSVCFATFLRFLLFLLLLSCKVPSALTTKACGFLSSPQPKHFAFSNPHFIIGLLST